MKPAIDPELRAKVLEHDWTDEHTRALIQRVEILKQLVECPLFLVSDLLAELKDHQRMACLGSMDGFFKIRRGVKP